MKKALTVITITLLPLFALSCTPSVPKETYDQLQSDYQALETNITQLKDEVAKLNTEKEDAQSDYQTSEARITQLEYEVAKLESEKEEAQSDYESILKICQEAQDDYEGMLELYLQAQDELTLYRDTFGARVYSGQPDDDVHIINNKSSINPTWEELKTFLESDKTDEAIYIEDIYDCSQFAERLHNNAERAGIKSAFVSIDIKRGSQDLPLFALPIGSSVVGHSLNAFVTSDKGLIYIDCTGKSIPTIAYPLPIGGTTNSTIIGDSGSYDKVAYLKIGSNAGFISSDVATPTNNYRVYEQWENHLEDFINRLHDYNHYVDVYNRAIRALPAYSIDESRWNTHRLTLEEQGNALESEGRTLGAFWIPLGEVTAIRIYW